MSTIRVNPSLARCVLKKQRNYDDLMKPQGKVWFLYRSFKRTERCKNMTLRLAERQILRLSAFAD
jgi:hypothetical protein